jgi:hypothetical protein
MRKYMVTCFIVAILVLSLHVAPLIANTPRELLEWLLLANNPHYGEDPRLSANMDVRTDLSGSAGMSAVSSVTKEKIVEFIVDPTTDKVKIWVITDAIQTTKTLDVTLIDPSGNETEIPFDPVIGIYELQLEEAEVW